MRAVQIRSTGGPEVLELADLPDPEPGAGEVVVEVGRERRELHRHLPARAGCTRCPLPLVLGAEGAGRVSRGRRRACTDLAVGDRVAWQGAPGSYAEQAAVPGGAAACPCRTASATRSRRPCCCRA